MAVTATVIAHEPLPGIAPLISCMPTSPAFNKVPLLSCSVPPQVFVVVVLAKVIGPGAVGVVGKVSVNVAPTKVTALLLNKVIVSVEIPPALIEVGENDLIIVGLASTSILALVGNALLPLGVISPPPAIVLV